MLDITASSVQMLIPWTGACFFAFMVFKSVSVLAGRKTTADLGLRLIGDIRVNEALAWLIAVISSGYGIRERRLRQKNIERSAATIERLESSIDTYRSSSRLTTRGTTRREDKI
jgi:hypothetical protein